MRTQTALRYFFVCVVIAMITVGCGTNGHLTRRYKSLTLTEQNNLDHYMDVSVFITDPDPTPPTPKKTIFDLSPAAQKELIRQFSCFEKNASSVITDISKPLSASPKADIRFIDYTRIPKRIVLTLKNKSHWPADRISKAEIHLCLSKEVRLLSCNRLETAFQTVDLGKVNYSNSLSAEVTGNLGVGASSSVENGGGNAWKSTRTRYDGDNNTYQQTDGSEDGSSTYYKTTDGSTNSQGLNGKLSGSRSFSEEVLLRQRIVALNVSVENNTLSVLQESISGIDLTGNIIADIVFDGQTQQQNVAVTKTFSFDDLTQADGQPIDPNKVGTQEVIITYFNFLNDITADLGFTGDFRHVNKKHKTITESDDCVTVYYCDTMQPRNVVLLRHEDLNPKFFELLESNIKLPLKIKSPTGTQGTLWFRDYSEASDFRMWLQQVYAKHYDTTNRKIVLKNGYEILFPKGSLIDNFSVYRS